ncbi:DNA polymerase III subunit delta [Candidatus Berkelbacteria bacterium]|nr:DNA polymerase III subunit delta [Candidatus Berkelbacteria bacterium]
MILFFYGEDTYRSLVKLKEIKAKYIDASLGDTNLAELDGRSVKAADLAPQIYALPFLAKSRLVIIRDAFTKTIQEELQDILPKVPDTTVLIIFESGLPDKRLKLFKELKKFAKVQEYPLLAGNLLNSWIRQFLSRWQVEIEPTALRELVERTGGVTARLATELTKLATQLLSEPSRVIVKQHIVEQVASSAPTSVFALTDALLRSPSQALKTLRQLLGQGENAQYLVAMVASGLRSLALIRWTLDQGHSPADIARVTKLNPFVVKKQLSLARSLSLAEITSSYRRLADLDIGVKHGTIESSLALELFVGSKLAFSQIA